MSIKQNIVCSTILACFMVAWSTPVFCQQTMLAADQVADLLILEAETHLGAPYHYGSRGPSSFDCSGFTGYVFRKFGITLSRSSSEQGNDGQAVAPGLGNLQKGDLVLFNGRKISKGKVGHVGIVVEVDTAKGVFTFIHASTSLGVIRSRSDEAYYKARYVGARRVLPNFLDLETALIDSAAVYPFMEQAHIRPDYLQLEKEDLRVVIFSNGRWALVDEDGKVVPGTLPERILLTKDGYWSEIATPMVEIPSDALPKDDE